MTIEQSRVGVAADRRRRPPQPNTSFVGRDTEFASVLRHLRSGGTKVVTIAGRSGAGKTRLAVEAARRLDADFAGGAVMIDVASIPESGLLAELLAAALDVPIVPGQSADETLRRSLEYRPTLIVADDIDRLDGAADWLINVVESSSGSRLLATAAVPLDHPGERVVRVGALSAQSGSADHVGLDDDPAVRLFADRAAAVDHSFSLDRANIRQVAELCTLLDRLPLAIELAAARSPTLSPGAQLRLLSRGTALDIAHVSVHSGRTRVLRDTITISHDLVPIDARRLLRRMAVFDAGMSIAALHAVCARQSTESEVIDALMLLVDAQLVEPDNRSAEPRYRLSPLIREFATEQLAAANERNETVDRHTDYYCSFARDLAGQQEQERIIALAEERLNLESVLSRLVANGDVVRGSILLGDLGRLWERSGWFPVSERWVETLIEEGEHAPEIDAATRALPVIWWVRLSIQHADAVARAERIVERQRTGLALARESGSVGTLLLALSSVVLSLFVTHDLAASMSAATEGLEVSRAAHDEHWITRFETWAGMASQQKGDLEAAESLGRSALARARRNNDLAGVIGPAMLLTGIAPHIGAGSQGPLPSYEELLADARELSDIRGEGWLLARVATQAAMRGDHLATVKGAISLLELGRRTGLSDAGTFGILLLTGPAIASGDFAEAARLYGSVRRVMPVAEISLGRDAMEIHRARIEITKQHLGAETHDRVAHGASLWTWDEAIFAALDWATRTAATMSTEAPVGADSAPAALRHVNEPQTSNAPAAGQTPLSDRELEVLRCVATGATNAEIGARLGLSTKTVMHYSVSIYAKLGVRGRAEATAWAYLHNVLSESQPT